MSLLKTTILLHQNTNIPFLALYDTNEKEMLLAWSQYAEEDYDWKSEKFKWVYCKNKVTMLFIILTKKNANLKIKRNEML